MPALSNLIVTLDLASDKFSQGINAASRAAKELDKTIKPLRDRAGDLGKALSVGVTLPLTALAGAATAAALKVDDAMDSIRAATGATGTALQGLGQDFKAVLGEVPNSIDDVATAIGDLNTRTGLAGKPLQDLATQMLNVSRLAKTDITETIASATRVFGDWGIATQNQSKALDFLFKVSQQTGVSFGQLGRTIVQYGAPLREMGLSFETSAALLGKFEKEGVNTELVLGSLRIALTNFARAGITDANAALEALSNQIKAAGSASKANEIAIKAFGARAGPDMAAAIREGRFEITELVKALNASGETINRAAADTLSFADKLKVLKNETILALEPIGTKMLDALERLMPTIQRVLGFVADLATAFSKLPPSAQEAVIAAGAFAAGLGPILTVGANVSRTITGIIGLFKNFPSIAGGAATAATSVGSALTGLGTALTGATGAWAVFTGGLAVAAIAAAAVAIYKIVDAYMALRDAQKQAAAAQATAQTSLDRAIASLREHGVAIETAGKSTKQLEMEVGEAGQALGWFMQQEKAAKAAIEAHGTAAKSTAIDTSKLGDDVDRLANLLNKGSGAAKQYKEALTVAGIQTKALSDLTRDALVAQLDMQGALATASLRFENQLSQEIDKAQAQLDELTNRNIWRERGREIEDALGDPLAVLTQPINVPPPRTDAATRKVSDTAKQWESIWANAMGGIVKDFVQATTDIIFSGGSFISKMKDSGLNAAKAFTSAFLLELTSPIEQALTNLGKRLADMLANALIGGLQGKLGNALGGLFGGGGGIIKNASGAAGSIGGVVSSAGGVAASAGTSLTGSLIAAGGAVLGGVISGLMSARQEGTLNAIEHNTRYLSIDFENTMNEILWPIHDWAQWIAGQATEHTSQLDAIWNILATISNQLGRMILAPATAIPSLASGGMVASTGLVFAHAGELIGQPGQWPTIDSRSAASNTSHSTVSYGDTVINIYEAASKDSKEIAEEVMAALNANRKGFGAYTTSSVRNAQRGVISRRISRQ